MARRRNVPLPFFRISLYGKVLSFNRHQTANLFEDGGLVIVGEECLASGSYCFFFAPGGVSVRAIQRPRA